VKRVLVIGPGGAGKSVLSRVLASVTGLPLVHLDREYWGPGWKMPDPDDWSARVAALTAGNAWILDGNHVATLEQRLERADAVVFLDFSRLTSLRGVATRLMTRAGRHRADLAPGCRNRLDRAYLHWVWRFQRETRPLVMEALARHGDRVIVTTVRSRRQANAWLDALKNTTA